MNKENTFALDLKKILSILLLIVIQVTTFSQIYADAVFSNTISIRKNTVQEKKANVNYYFDAFENEEESEDDSDFHSNAYLVSSIIKLCSNAILADEVKIKAYTNSPFFKAYHNPLFIINRQLLI